MLPRILEPEIMDSPNDAKDYDAMDHSVVNQRFVADFLQVWNGRSPILDVGTGTAQIPIEFCRQSPSGTIIAIDLAQSMIDLGWKNVRCAGLEDRIELRRVNARSTGFAEASFPAIMSNSIIHHIPEPIEVFREMLRLASPGATLFVRDLMRPRDLAELEHLVQTYAGDANAHQRQLFRDSLHAALTVAEVQELVGHWGFAADSVRPTSDRHWTWSAVCPGEPST